MLYFSRLGIRQQVAKYAKIAYMKINGSSKATAVSLFSGAGGLDVGFINAGFEILWANDLNKDACATYNANVGKHIVCGEIDPLIDGLDKFRNVDCVFGGPPCQGFSVAGKMEAHDPRSKLIWSFMHVVQKLQPKLFIMENVKALAKLAKFRLVREELMLTAMNMGYYVDLLLLNSKDFGVPQSRERMFLIGLKDIPLEGMLSEHIKAQQSRSPTVRDVIFPYGKAGNKSNPRTCKAKITIAQRPVLRKSPYAGMLFNGQGRPLNPDGYSCSLHASMGGNKTPIIDEKHLYHNAASWVEKYHAHLISGGTPYPLESTPQFLRRLTVDEALLLQSFPRWYRFIGSQSSVFRQIGNAVPCRLSEAVSTLAMKALDGKLTKNPTWESPNKLQLAMAL